MLFETTDWYAMIAERLTFNHFRDFLRNVESKLRQYLMLHHFLSFLFNCGNVHFCAVGKVKCTTGRAISFKDVLQLITGSPLVPRAKSNQLTISIFGWRPS